MSTVSAAWLKRLRHRSGLPCSAQIPTECGYLGYLQYIICKQLHLWGLATVFVNR